MSEYEEALSNLGATEVISVLQGVLHDPEESRRLQKWCKFALSESKSGDR
jgi:hypothetical protein